MPFRQALLNGLLALGHGEALPSTIREAYTTLDERTKLFVRRG